MTHPKIPIAKFTRYIDFYLAAFPSALIVLATDDARYHAQLTAQYGAKVVGAFSGYSTRNVVRDPAINPYDKGRSGLVDALLLAHTDFLLKGTSSLSEFAMWYNPSLIERHLDLQIEGAGEASATYQGLIPRWAGGAYEPPTLKPSETAEARLQLMLSRARGRDAQAESSGGRPSLGPNSAATLPPNAVRLESAALAKADEAGQGPADEVMRKARKRKRLKKLELKNRKVEQRRRAAEVDDEGGAEGVVPASVPTWPVPRTVPVVPGGPSAPRDTVAVADAAVMEIASGRCDARGHRLLSEAQCSELATQDGHSYIGKTVEKAEFPGCVRWGGGYVEFNGHTDESVGCHVGGEAPGKPPACLCGGKL